MVVSRRLRLDTVALSYTHAPRQGRLRPDCRRIRRLSGAASLKDKP